MKNTQKSCLILALIAFISISCEKDEEKNLSNPKNLQLTTLELEEFTPDSEQAVNLVKRFFKDRDHYAEEQTESISDWEVSKAFWTIEAAANYHFPLRTEKSFSSIHMDSSIYELSFFTEEDVNKVTGVDLCHVYEQLKSFITSITEDEEVQLAYIDLDPSQADDHFSMKFKVVYGVRGWPPMGDLPEPLPTGWYNALQAGNEFDIRVHNVLPINRDMTSQQLGDPYYHNNILGSLGQFTFYASNNIELWGPKSSTLTGFTALNSYWNNWLNTTWELLGLYHEAIINYRVILRAEIIPGEYYISGQPRASHNMHVTSAKWYPNSEDIATH